MSYISYRKKPSFKSGPKVVFTLYKCAAGSLELAQKLKFVKNFETKKILEVLLEWNLSNKFIEINLQTYLQYNFLTEIFLIVA